MSTRRRRIAGERHPRRAQTWEVIPARNDDPPWVNLVIAGFAAVCAMGVLVVAVFVLWRT